MTPAFALGLIGLSSLICQLIAWRYKFPSILLLLLVGLLLGPTLHVLQPDTIFQGLLSPIISISVAIILFEGSLSLNFEKAYKQRTAIFKLVTLGVLIGWALTALALVMVAHLGIALALLVAALLIVTGPTVIKPIMEAVRPVETVENILKWEGIVLDSIGGIFAVAMFTFIISERSEFSSFYVSLLQLGKVIITGGIIGVGVAYALKQCLIQVWLPTALKNFFVINVVVLSFMVSNYLAKESGLITVTILGMVLANQKSVNIDDILEYKENLTILLLSAIFIILAARINFQNSADDLLAAIFLVAIMQFIIQPLKTFICLKNSDLSWREKFLIGWIAPKGIISAALISLFSLALAPMYPNLQIINLVFYIILINVLLISLTAKFIAKKLNLSEGHSSGILIIGSTKFSRELAKLLLAEEHNVLVVDSSWNDISVARLLNIPVYFGNPLSEKAEKDLSVRNLGMLLALSSDENLNALSSLRFQREFGHNHIFFLQSNIEQQDQERHRIGSRFKGKKLFDGSLTVESLEKLMDGGATLHCVRLSEEFTFKDFLEKNQSSLVLFEIKKNHQLKPFIREGNNIHSESKLIYLSTSQKTSS